MLYLYILYIYRYMYMYMWFIYIYVNLLFCSRPKKAIGEDPQLPQCWTWIWWFILWISATGRWWKEDWCFNSRQTWRQNLSKTGSLEQATQLSLSTLHALQAFCWVRLVNQGQRGYLKIYDLSACIDTFLYHILVAQKLSQGINKS